MSTVRLWSDAEMAEVPEVAAVVADIKAVRGSDFINNIWRALANDPALMARVWAEARAVMAPGALDAVVKEMIYVAVSVANGCSYCVHSHMAAGRAKGMTEAMRGELMSVIGLAMQTNGLAVAYQVPVDDAFLVG